MNFIVNFIYLIVCYFLFFFSRYPNFGIWHWRKILSIITGEFSTSKESRKIRKILAWMPRGSEYPRVEFCENSPISRIKFHRIPQNVSGTNVHLRHPWCLPPRSDTCSSWTRPRTWPQERDWSNVHCARAQVGCLQRRLNAAPLDVCLFFVLIVNVETTQV